MICLPSTHAVVDHGEVAVRRAEQRHDHPAVVGGVDDRAAGEVRAGVQLGVVQDRVEPHAERRGDAAVQRVREEPVPCTVSPCRASCSDRLSICAPSWPDSAIRAWLSAMSLPPAAWIAVRAVDRCAGEGGEPGRWRRPAPSSRGVPGGDAARSRALTSCAPDDRARRAARRRGWRCPRPAGSRRPRCPGRARRSAGAMRWRCARRRPRRSPSPGRAAPSRRRPASAGPSAASAGRSRRCPGPRRGTTGWRGRARGWTRRRPGPGGRRTGDHRGGVGLPPGGLLARGAAVPGSRCQRPGRGCAVLPSGRRRPSRPPEPPPPPPPRAASACSAVSGAPGRLGVGAGTGGTETVGSGSGGTDTVGRGGSATRRRGRPGRCPPYRRRRRLPRRRAAAAGTRARTGRTHALSFSHGDTVTNERAAAQVTLSRGGRPRRVGRAVGSGAFSRNGAGSSGSPSMRTSKCRCGPVA